MRGKGGQAGEKEGITRITPAYAGKRCGASFCSAHGMDHPRLCGEKSNFSSSDGSIGGITPAYAGKR